MAPVTQTVKSTRPTDSAMLSAKNATTQKELVKTSGKTNTLNKHYKRPGALAMSFFFLLNYFFA